LIRLPVLIKIFYYRVGHIRIKACGENNLCTTSWLCEAGTKSPKGCTVIYCREDVTIYVLKWLSKERRDMLKERVVKYK